MSSLIVFPPSLPAALVEGHGFRPMPNGRDRERDQGELRRRPRFRRTLELCTVRWLLRQAQFDEFHDWYEDQLIVGTEAFDVRVQERGTEYGTTWFTAQFVADYTCEVLLGIWYRVSATLRLVEEIGPVRLPPGIQAVGRIRFGGGAAMPPPPLQAVGAIVFGGRAAMGVPVLGAVGAITFGGSAVMDGLSPDSFREADTGDERETDAGGAREID